MFKPLLVVCTLFFVVEAENVLISTVLKAINKTINYIAEHENEVLMDCIVGVHYARAFLVDISQTQKMNSYADHKPIIAKMDNIIQSSHNRKDNYSLSVLQIFSNETLMDKPINFNKIVLPIYELNSNGRSPKKLNFTECYQNIVSTSKARNMDFDCNLDKNCFYNNTKDLTNYSGYYLTHKLIYFQLARAYKCLRNDNNFKRRIGYICSKLYQEIIFMYNNNNKLLQSFDLFLEEILLCAYEGYWQFLGYKFLDTILISQSHSGCFKLYPNGAQSIIRKKRSFAFLDDGCIDHTTGVALGVLSGYYSLLYKSLITDH